MLIMRIKSGLCYRGHRYPGLGRVGNAILAADSKNRPRGRREADIPEFNAVLHRSLTGH